MTPFLARQCRVDIVTVYSHACEPVADDAPGDATMNRSQARVDTFVFAVLLRISFWLTIHLENGRPQHIPYTRHGSTTSTWRFVHSQFTKLRLVKRRSKVKKKRIAGKCFRISNIPCWTVVFAFECRSAWPAIVPSSISTLLYAFVIVVYISDVSWSWTFW